MVFVNKFLKLAVKQEMKIFVKTKRAGNDSQIFPNWSLLLNRQKSQDFCWIDKSLRHCHFRQCLMFYDPASTLRVSVPVHQYWKLANKKSLSTVGGYFGSGFFLRMRTRGKGPMLWFLKYFRRKILRKNWRFWLNTKLNFEKVDHNIGI
jgi:hypothetical protein